MRKIEQAMLNAIKNKRNWKSGNTEVVYYPEVVVPTFARIESSKVFLHGNHLATYVHESGKMVANKDTLRDWPTPTTCSRLRALGIGAHLVNRQPHIDGVLCRGN